MVMVMARGGESGVGPCALMLGVQDATTLPSEDELGRLMAAAEESGVTGDAAGGESEVPADLEGVLRQLESVTRELGTLKQGVAATAQVHVSELKRSRKWEQSMLSASSGEQHKRKREIQSQASELARLERQVLVQGQALKEMQLRLQQSDTGRDPQTGEFAEAVYHPLAHAGRLGAPTDSQIVALAYAMERTFPCKAVLSDLCKLLRFKAHATSPGGGRCSPREQFCNKRYSLDMWRDLAVNRGVFWSCYNFLLLRQPYSTLVDPSKGEPGVLSYHNSRFVSPPPGGRMPWHGAPEGVYTGPPPLPRLIYTASDSDGSELPASPSGVLLEPRRHSSATPLMSGLMLYSPLGRPASQPMGREALLPPPKRSPSGQLVRLSPASPGAPRGAARQRATIRRAPRMVGIGKPLRVGGKRATVDADEEEEESEGSEESEGEASGDSDGEEAAQSREEAALEAAKGRPTRKEKRETKEAQETEALEEARLYEREAELCHPDARRGGAEGAQRRDVRGGARRGLPCAHGQDRCSQGVRAGRDELRGVALSSGATPHGQRVGGAWFVCVCAWHVDARGLGWGVVGRRCAWRKPAVSRDWDMNGAVYEIHPWHVVRDLNSAYPVLAQGVGAHVRDGQARRLELGRAARESPVGSSWPRRSWCCARRPPSPSTCGACACGSSCPSSRAMGAGRRWAQSSCGCSAGGRRSPSCSS